MNLDELSPKDLPGDPETGRSRVFLNGCFEILGASIGDKCNAYTQDKVNKEPKLLEQIAQIDDPQVAVKVMRSCAGVCSSPTT